MAQRKEETGDGNVDEPHGEYTLNNGILRLLRLAQLK